MIQMNEIITMIKGGYNPQQLLMSILQSQMRGTPLGENLLTMVRSGDSSGIEKIARNIASQRGIDFDREFKAFRSQFGL